MGKYLIKRVLMAVFTVFLVATVTFFLMNAVPGNPWLSDKTPPQSVIDALNAKYGLDKESFGLIERAVKSKEEEFSRKTKRETVPFKNLHKGIPDSTYQRIRKSLINTGFEIDD